MHQRNHPPRAQIERYFGVGEGPYRHERLCIKHTHTRTLAHVRLRARVRACGTDGQTNERTNENELTDGRTRTNERRYVRTYGRTDE